MPHLHKGSYLKPPSRLRIFLRQLKAQTAANLKSRYRNTFSGFLWVLLNPVFLYLAQGYAFRMILKIQVENYFMFLLAGLVPWIFLSQTVEMGASVFLANGRMLKSFPIHPLTCLFALCLDNAINFVAAFIIILIPVGIMSSFNFINLILLPIPTLILFFGVFSMAWFFAIANIFFRDIKFILSFVLTIAYFMTPIFYPESFVDPQFHWIIQINFLSHFVVPFRNIIDDPWNMVFVHNCVRELVTSCILFLIAYTFWRKTKNAAYLRL